MNRLGEWQEIIYPKTPTRSVNEGEVYLHPRSHFGLVQVGQLLPVALMTVVRNVRANGAATLHCLNLRRTSSLLAIAGALAVAPAFGQQPAAPETKPIPKGQAVQGQPEPAGAQARPANRDQVNQNQAQAEAPVIPECLEKLNLSAQQQEQVKGIVHNYDGSISMVWKQFSDRYMKAVCMEPALMAAIEDSLTEPQRQQVRDQRRRMAQHEKAVAGTNSKANQAAVKPNEETTKLSNAGDAAEERIAAAGVSLTDEQEMAADKVQEKYGYGSSGYYSQYYTPSYSPYGFGIYIN